MELQSFINTLKHNKTIAVAENVILFVVLCNINNIDIGNKNN